MTISLHPCLLQYLQMSHDSGRTGLQQIWRQAGCLIYSGGC